MKRWLGHFAAAISLLLLAATLTAWIGLAGSERRVGLGYGAKGLGWYATANSAGVHLSYCCLYDGKGFRFDRRYLIEHYIGGDRWVGMGFVARLLTRAAAAAVNNRNGAPYGSVLLPYWFLVLCTLVGPLMWASRQLRRRRPKGCCEFCGYDLRATPARCPECGRAPTKATDDAVGSTG